MIPNRLVVATLAGGALLAYANSFAGLFQFDDFNVIVAPAAVHSWSGWWANLGHGLRPLLKLSYLLNWESGLGMFGFHLFNLLIHILNSLLVYGLALTFGRQVDPARAWQGVALLTALLFALHPVHTEAVTYLSGRSISLMATFYFAGLLTYAHGNQEGRLWLRYGASPALFVLALGVKESALLFPLALILWELCLGTKGREIGRRQWLHWLVFGVGFLVCIGHDRYWEMMIQCARAHGLADNLRTQLNGAGYLLSRLVCLTGLNIDPDLPVVREWGSLWPLLLAGAGLGGWALGRLRTRPWLAFALGWMLLHLLALYIWLPRSDVANERHLYLADWGLFFLLAAESRRWWSHRMVVGGWGVVLLVLLVATVARNQCYRSEVGLWSDTVAKSPGKARPYNNLGYAYRQAGRRAEAREAYLTALRLDPNYVKARYNLLSLDTVDGDERR